jgi:hypothetical protein
MQCDLGKLASGNANFLCYCATGFQDYIKEDLQSTDQWRVLTAVFLLMSSDFLAFVIAYRECDAIIVEQYYQRFAPVWRVIGAKRYLERHWRQLESSSQNSHTNAHR